MNTSMRNSGNQFRDTFQPYGIPPQHGHNLRDGMNYPPLNTLPVGVHSAAAVVAAPSAGNAPPQTSHYVQGTSLQTSAVASGITVNPHGLSQHGGITTTTQTVLSLPNQHSHSQGPTPANTPPAAPNDPKTTAHYSQQTASFQPHMNYTNYNSATARMYYNPRTVPHNQSARGIPHLGGTRQPFISYPNSYAMQLPALIASPIPNPTNNTVTFGHYPSDQFSNLYLSQQNPSSSQTYPMSAYPTALRPAASGVRATNQTQVYSNSNVPAPVTYISAVNQLTHYTHQQQQQQQQTVKASLKDRKNRVTIRNPITGEEVFFGDIEQQPNDKTSVKSEDVESNARNVVVEELTTKIGKSLMEPSNSSTTHGSAPKEESSPGTGNAVNGTVRNASAAASTNPTSAPATTTSTSYIPASSKPDYGSGKSSTTTSSQSTVGSTVVNSFQNVAASGNDSNSVEAPVVNSVIKSSSNAAANVNQSKQPMDYKRPTREEMSTTPSATPTTKPSQSWPETGPKSSVSVSAAPTTVSSSAPAAKKIPKDSAETTSAAPVVTSSVGSSQSSVVAAAPTSVLSLTPSQDGLKAPSVTNTVVLEDSNESASCKKTFNAKQGISGVAPIDEADSTAIPTTAKPASPALPRQPGKFAGSAIVSSQSLPSAGPSVSAGATAGSTPPTSAALVKTDPKASSVPPQQKPSASALQTSGPVNEKPPFSSKTAVAPAATPTPASAEKNVTNVSDKKDDKAANPSTKTKNRSKENAEPNVDQTGKKSAPSVPPTKHHNAETTAKSAQNAPATASVAPVTGSKQTNGDAADSQGGTEGKSKKIRKPVKKEINNKKGFDKEGSDMDVFTEKPASPPEKTRNEKVNPVVAAQTNSTAATANRSSKTNSSQKPVDDKQEISAVESNKGLVTQQNIPSTRTVPTSDSQKTEQTVVESRPRKYTVEYLKSLRELPQCNKLVKVANDFAGSLYSKDGFSNMMRSQSAYHSVPNNNFMMPAFMNAGRGSMTLPTRKSQQSRPKNERQPPIHVTLSLKEDVPLRSSKDAWKPARLNSDIKNLSDDEKKTQELYKTVTGILNKLTPEKFDALIEKIKNLPIDDAPRLQGVIDLIFDKAIDEPGFCKWYAEMCHVMQAVHVFNKEEDKTESFRTLLINKCQQQFERDKAEELDVIKKQEEIDACTDPEKKKELQLLFEEIERKVRRKSVGNCRFIGELFKLQMLTPKIMLRCTSKLLQSTDEESLECLCKLLTTIGKDLESKLSVAFKKQLEADFDQMQDLSESKKHKVSSRIRFMLQDVIDLRKNEWVPRREADNPKKIEQINAEHERKEQEIKMMNLQPLQRRGGDDYYSNRNRDFNKKGTRTGSQNDDEWKTVGKNFKNNYKVDTNKFNAIGSTNQPQVSDSLGPTGGYKQWSSGVASKHPGDKKSVQNLFNQPPMFPMDKPQLSSSNSFRSLSNKVTPSSSMEKPKPYPNRDAAEVGKISRSGSAQNIHPSSRENSVPRQQPSSRNASQSAKPPTSSSTPSAPAMLSADEVKKASVFIFQEYDTNNDLKDSIETFEEQFNPKQVPDVVQEMMNYIIENKPKSATKFGELLANLIKRECVTKKHFIEAGKNFYELADDLIIDCPNMWITLAEISNVLIAQDCLQINDLQTEIPSKAFLDHIKCSNEAHVDKNSILKKHLLGCLRTDNFNEIIKWIDENFENSRNSTTLVSILSKMICEIIDNEWRKESKPADDSEAIEGTMKTYMRLFKIYIENKSDLEMQCLLTVHDHVAKASYPRGLLQKILELMYDMKLISYDSFIQWKNSERTPGVAMAQLNQFFQYLGDEQQNEDNSNH